MKTTPLALLIPSLLLPALRVQGTDDDPQVARDQVVIQTLLRLPGFDYTSNPKAQAAVQRELKRLSGTDKYLELVDKLDIRDQAPQLTQLAIDKSTDSVGVNAALLLHKFEQLDELVACLTDKEVARRDAAATVLGLMNHKASREKLLAVVEDPSLDPAIRNSATQGLGRNTAGQRMLLRLLKNGKLPESLTFAVGNALHGSRNAEIREQAAELLPLPASKNSKPLPPVNQLVKQRGNVTDGETVFASVGTCNKCHLVRGKGKSVGPDLTEIGSKLSRDALYVSILDPSAGISHNYETYSLITAEGDMLSGLMVNRTDDRITLKDAEGIDRTFATEEIDDFKKQPLSLMPADLQKNLTEQQLVDLVEYLTTLKKPTN